MLVDLYVNYDCDLDAPNAFERMVICNFPVYLLMGRFRLFLSQSSQIKNFGNWSN